MLAFRRAGMMAGATFKVGSVTVNSGGEYSNTSATVTFSGGGGSGASAGISFQENSYAGPVTTVYVSPNHSAPGYTMTSALPTVSFSGGGGSGAAANFTGWNTGRLHSATGSLEVSSDSVSYTLSGGGGSGAAIANQTGLPPRRASVSSVGVTAGGSGYTVAPTVVFTLRAGLGFSQVTLPTATANLNSGQVSSITITNPGEYIRPDAITSGWYGYDVSLSGGNGSGASVFYAHGVNALSWWAGPSISNGVDGSFGYSITNRGTGYTSAPTISVSNYVSGSQPVAVIGRDPADTSLQVTTGGSYTSQPTVTISGGTTLTTPNWGTNAIGGWYSTYTVTGVGLNTQGSGYRSAPSVSISGGSPITPAVLTANMIPG